MLPILAVNGAFPKVEEQPPLGACGVGEGVSNGETTAVAVGVGRTGVAVGGTGVGVGVAVGGTRVGVAVGGTGVCVGVGEAVGIAVGVSVGVAVGGTAVGVGVGVSVGLGVRVAVAVGVAVGGTAVGVGVGRPMNIRPKFSSNAPSSKTSVVPDFTSFRKNSTGCPINERSLGSTIRFLYSSSSMMAGVDSYEPIRATRIASSGTSPPAMIKGPP